MSLIISLIVTNLLIIYFGKIILEKRYKKKNNDYKNRLSSVLALNISHLHDAANFFSLIKNQTSDSNSRNFAKGASYHFRSLFDELKQSKKSFDEGVDDSINVLYYKEVIDIKDLLELELLQLSHNGRIELIDESKAEHALIKGNFSLLSKSILNLAENALKYTDKQIKIELTDKDNKWQIKISSFGKEIPPEMALEINEPEGTRSSLGHGLASLKQIMDFHHAQVIVDTLAGEGSSIRLIFKKYNSNDQEKSTKVNSRKAFRLNNQFIILGSLVLIVLSLIYIIDHNKRICLNYYNRLVSGEESNNIILKERICRQELSKLYQFLLDDDLESYEFASSQFLQQFKQKDRDLVSLILFEQFLSKVSMPDQKLINRVVKTLIVEFPNSINLNAYLSNYYYQKSYYGRMLIHSLRLVLAVFEAKLYIHPRLYVVATNGQNLELSSQFLAKLYSDDNLPVYQPQPSPNLIEDTDAIEMEEEPKIENQKLDELIDQQDEDLGLDLESF